MVLQLDEILLDRVTLSSISKNEWLFKSVKYMSILNMLRCYSNGLEAKHLSYELVKEVIAKKGKINKKTNHPLLQKEHQVSEYLKKKDEGCFYKDRIQEGCITTRANLDHYLYFLKKCGLIFKDGKKYKITKTAMETLLIKGDVAILNNYLFLSQGMSHAFPLVISDPYMNIYCHPLLFSEYTHSKTMKEKIDGIKEDIKKPLMELANLSVEFRTAFYNELLLELLEECNKDYKETDREYDEAVSQIKKYINMLIRRKSGSLITIVLHSRGTRMKADILDFIGMDEDLYQKIKKSKIYGEKKELFDLVSEMFK